MRKSLIGVLLLTGCSANSGWVDSALKVLDPVAYEREKEAEQAKIKLAQCRKDLESIPVAAGSSVKLGELSDRGCLSLHVYNPTTPSPGSERDYGDIKSDFSDFVSDFNDKQDKVVTLEVDLRRTRFLVGAERIQSIRDAELVYEHGSVESIMRSPLIKSDGEIYSGVITLDAQEDENLLRGKIKVGFVDSPDVYYVFIRTGADTTIFHPDRLRIGQYVGVMGRYVKNTTYRTVIGTEKMAPILDAMFIE